MYIYVYLINHTHICKHSRSPQLLPMLFTLPVVAAHFILILILRLFRNNRNIRCDRDVDCAACCSAAVSALASIFSVSVAALSPPSPPFHSLCWQLCCCLCNDFLSLQHYIILINLFTIIHHTHSHLQWNMFICLFIANYSQNHVREISIQQQQQQREYLQLLLQLEQSNNNNN